MEKELSKYLIEQCKDWMLPEEIKALGQIELTEIKIKNAENHQLAKKKIEMVYGIGEE